MRQAARMKSTTEPGAARHVRGYLCDGARDVV